MGTRSLTRVFDGKTQLLNLYRQMDGYPSGHGTELAEFLSGITMVNGLGLNNKRVANGAGCLAAQIVAHFKDAPGGFYIRPTSAKDCDQEYEYHVLTEFNSPEIVVVIYEVSIFYLHGFDNPGTVTKKAIFRGNAVQLLSYCSPREAA